MDYKEKFEDFLTKMQGLLNEANRQGHIIVRVEDLERTFPELKESEDERIRKSIIKFLIDVNNGAYTKSELEIASWIAWLEKQCEQKPVDKVKSKFKVGDWVTNSIETLQITGYDIDYGYQVDYKGNLLHRDTDIIEKEYHLWTIEDAKDGDVLCCENGWTCIFNCLHNNLFDSHCFMDAEGWFCEDKGQAHTLDNRICGEIHPATKEQRDLLFSKIKEAGYEWDAEKKELKKIVQKPAWSEDDETCLNTTVAYLKDAKEFKKTAENCITWLKSIKQRIIK